MTCQHTAFKRLSLQISTCNAGHQGSYNKRTSIPCLNHLVFTAVWGILNHFPHTNGSYQTKTKRPTPTIVNKWLFTKKWSSSEVFVYTMWSVLFVNPVPTFFPEANKTNTPFGLSSCQTSSWVTSRNSNTFSFFAYSWSNDDPSMHESLPFLLSFQQQKETL